MIACSMIIKIIYSRENQSCPIKWYTMVSLYMRGNQNKHGKIRVTTLSKVRWAINIINISMSQTNIAMKHGKKKCHNRNVQSRQTIIIINMSMSLVKTNAQACVKCNDIKSSQCVINSRINTRTKRGRYPLIDQSNWFVPNWCLSWFVSSWCSLIEGVINKIYNLLHHELG